MNKILIILSLVVLASCGPSAEEKRQVEMEQQRIEQEASEKLAQEKANRIAAVTCSIMGETRNMDAAIRVEKMNDARDKIGGEPFLRGDSAIQEAFEFGLCQELVLGTYDETLQSLKDAEQERERIADSKPTVKEEFYSNGKLKGRTNYQSKNDGGKKHGLSEKLHDNGQLKSKENYKDGKLHGLREWYHENGKLRVKGNFKDDKPDGLWEWYHENGQLNSNENYKDGKRDGLWESYHDNGQLNSKTNYKDGEWDGLLETYHDNGELRSKVCYKNGEKTNMSYCEK
jgi:antitoxin component YwqK of YwqJK toxin-antitoxin module